MPDAAPVTMAALPRSAASPQARTCSRFERTRRGRRHARAAIHWPRRPLRVTMSRAPRLRRRDRRSPARQPDTRGHRPRGGACRRRPRLRRRDRPRVDRHRAGPRPSARRAGPSRRVLDRAGSPYRSMDGALGSSATPASPTARCSARAPAFSTSSSSWPATSSASRTPPMRRTTRCPEPVRLAAVVLARRPADDGVAAARNAGGRSLPRPRRPSGTTAGSASTPPGSPIWRPPAWSCRASTRTASPGSSSSPTTASRSATLFVPQTSSAPDAAHPVVAGFVEAVHAPQAALGR